MSETPNTITAIKKELLMRLGHDADIFALDLSVYKRAIRSNVMRRPLMMRYSYSWTKKKQKKKLQN